MFTRHPAAQRERLAAGSRTAQSYMDSPLVRLRHVAPVGHGFGVPSPAEVLAAWQASREALARHEPAVLAADGYLLPGLPSLFSAVAGAPVRPGTLLRDTAAVLTGALPV